MSDGPYKVHSHDKGFCVVDSFSELVDEQSIVAITSDLKSAEITARLANQCFAEGRASRDKLVDAIQYAIKQYRDPAANPGICVLMTELEKDKQTSHARTKRFGRQGGRVYVIHVTGRIKRKGY